MLTCYLGCVFDMDDIFSVSFFGVFIKIKRAGDEVALIDDHILAMRFAGAWVDDEVGKALLKVRCPGDFTAFVCLLIDNKVNFCLLYTSPSPRDA